MIQSLSDFHTVGVISDIHANYVALEAVLEYLQQQKVQAMLFLGDYITDGPEPQRTLQLLRQTQTHMPCFFIRGNREQYLIQHADDPSEVWEAGRSTGALLYTWQHITPEDIRWFRTMPMCHSFDDVILCHGSPDQINGLLDVNRELTDNTDQAEYWIRQMQQPLMLCGHTHRQGQFCGTAADGRSRSIVNVGSAGLTHNHDDRARAALLRRADGGWKTELLAIPYDVKAITAAYHASELMDMAPAWSLANIRFLQTGHNYIMRLIRKANQLAREQGSGFSSGEMEWKPIFNFEPELWMQAARELDLL